ncbi:MAG: glycosyltransferase [Actinomycetota bacterium]|nr:glycosyltransferase [Actinomycetota bacterium]
MTPPSLSVVVPAYNEAEEIPTIVPAVLDVLRVREGTWELIVVDNASEDDTVARMAPFLEDPRVRLIRNERNRGKGYSVRRGMLAATGELRLMCDADCTPSLSSLPALEAMIVKADIVAGARNAATSQVERYQPIERRAASLAFIFLCRRIMGEPLRDVFCGFKLFTAAAAEDVFSRSQIDGWAFDAETLAMARALGYRVAPCGIVWTHRPGSRLSVPRIMIPVLRELIATRTRLKGAVARPGINTAEKLASAPGPRR